MVKHNGMRPQDVVVLLKIAALDNTDWMMKDLSASLYISRSEVTESLQRSVVARLIAQDKKYLMRHAVLNFLKHGLPHVFPGQPGAETIGLPTAHSAAPLSSEILASIPYVWPSEHGNTRGLGIAPLYQGAPQAALHDAKLYELLALTDALRVGKPRERALAFELLTQKLAA